MNTYRSPFLRRAVVVLVLTGLVLAGLVLPARPAAAQGFFNLPYGFIQEVVTSGLELPTSFALAPDGRIFFSEKSGRVRVMVDGELLGDPFVDLSTEVNDSADRGLTSVAVHPDWPAQPYVYVTYVYDPPEIKDRNPSGARVSRVLRLTADPNNLNLAQPGSGAVIVGTNSTAEYVGNPDQGDAEPFTCVAGDGGFVRDCIPAEGTAHTVDFLKFGPDGALYVAMGDGIVNSKGNSRALNPDSLAGKILRVDPMTGAGYPDNPFFDGDPNSNRSKVFVMGMRNPFRFTIDPRTGEVILGDVGNEKWEEINRGGPGANFGWPCYEGPFEAATYADCDAYRSGAAPITQPIHYYPHTTKPQRGSAIGGDLYLASNFPPLYRGAYFYHDFNGGVVNFLTFRDDGSAVDNEFGTNIPGIVQMTVGPDGALYMVSVIMGQLYKVRYQPGGNKPPVAALQADPTGGKAPLEVTFSSKRSTDPEKSIVGYLWDFGDGETSSKANPVHTYEDNGTYEVSLTVTDSGGLTSSDTVEIVVGSEPPTAEILKPGDGAKFRIGEEIAFEGKATDADEGELSGAALQWGGLLHHGEHVHYDAFTAEGNTGTFKFEDHGDDTYLELCLTATDAQGQQDTDCVDVKPKEVTYTFASVPSGLPLVYAGSRYETPFKVQTYVDATRIVEAPATTEDGLVFQSWSDEGEAVHEIVIQDGPQTLTATYGDAEGEAPAVEAADAAALENAPMVTPEAEAHEHDAAAEAGAEAEPHEHDAMAAPTEVPTEEPTGESAAKPAAAAAAGGGILRELWRGIGGTTVEELTASPQFRNDAPETDVLNRLSLPRGGGDAYGVRLRGYLLPPASGEYRFWIAADDRGALALSTDADPANKIVIAFTPNWTGAEDFERYPEQISGPIELQAGERYYVEVLYKQGDGKDNLAVAWQPPGGERVVIAGEYLAPYEP